MVMNLGKVCFVKRAPDPKFIYRQLRKGSIDVIGIPIDNSIEYIFDRHSQYHI